MPPLPHLRSLRERKLMSQIDLSQKSGVAQATISNLEQGRPARFVTIRKLARALGVRPAELSDTALPPPAAPEPPVLVPIDERKAVMVANMLDQAERARARGDDAGVAQFERMAAEAASAEDAR